jgi:hypothetical protein
MPLVGDSRYRNYCGPTADYIRLEERAQPMTTAHLSAFDDIVARFGDKPHCEDSDRCTRPASWRINLHCCEQAIMCAQHKNAWLRRIRAEQATGHPRCAHCSVVFETVDAAITVTAI